MHFRNCNFFANANFLGSYNYLMDNQLQLRLYKVNINTDCAQLRFAASRKFLCNQYNSDNLFSTGSTLSGTVYPIK